MSQHPAVVEAAIGAANKVSPSPLSRTACLAELERARNRMGASQANGRKGRGRPPKEINEIDKPAGFGVGLESPKAINLASRARCREMLV